MTQKHKVLIAGAGPGAMDLITLRAFEAIKNADVIIYAGSLVNPKLLENAKLECEKFNSALMSLPEVIEVIKKAALSGKLVLRLHTGDPAMYGAISEQMNELDNLNIEYEIIPGVSSVFASSAALRTELTMPGITQTLILTRRAGRTPVPEEEHLSRLAQNNASLAIFLSIGDIPGMVKDLCNAGRSIDTPVAVVYRVSWENQKIVRGTLADIAEKVEQAGIKRQAMIIVGEALNRNGELSKLYHNNFAHGYRGNKNSEKFKGSVAIYAITEQGCHKAAEIKEGLTNRSQIFIPERFSSLYDKFTSFPPKNLEKIIAGNWKRFDAHIFIMAT